MPVTTTPTWWSQIRTAFASGEAHGFILDGDIAGYVQEMTSLRRYLEAALAQPRGKAAREANLATVVVSYTRAAGIDFTTDEGRAAAIAMLDGDSASKAAKGSAIGVGNSASDKALAAFGASSAAPSQDPFQVQAPLAALRVLDRLLRAPAARNRVSVIIYDADLVVPDGEKGMLGPDDRTILALLRSWARDAVLAQSSNLIVMLSPTVAELHADVRSADSNWRTVNVPLPDEAQRRGFIEFYINTKGTPLAEGVTPDGLARQMAGLNLRHIEDVLLRGAAAGAVEPTLVKSRKDEIIRDSYSKVAVMLDPLPGGLDALGGSAHIKTYLREDVIRPIKEGRKRDAVKGLMFVGNPGTGKTELARALAGEANMNVIKLDMSSIQDSLVGASERNLAKVLNFALALAPVILFVDELDQTDIANRGNSSGNPVAKNLFNQTLQFMGDEAIRGRVIVIAASNQPNLLDPALMRRFDAIIPVLLPDRQDRAEIAVKHFIANEANVAGNDVIDTLADGSDKWSAADVARCVGKAVRFARRRSADEAVTVEDVAMAVKVSRPNSPKVADQYTRWAIDACNDLSLLPPAMLAMIDQIEVDLATEAAAAAAGRVTRDW